jgi:cysteine-S-conjugate beta-lyase
LDIKNIKMPISNEYFNQTDRINTNSIKWDMNKRVFGTDDILPMWVADMDFKCAPAIVNAIQSRNEHGVYGYGFNPDTYYNGILDWLGKRHQWKVEKEWLLDMPGVIPALAMVIQALTRKNDKILVHTPVYNQFFEIIKANGRELITNDLKLQAGKYVIDFDEMEKTFKTGIKMFVLCSPHNPVGRVWTIEELTGIISLCVKYNVVIVSDEIHFDIVYKPNKHIPIA